MRSAPLPQQRIWTAIRILKRDIDLRGLAHTAGTSLNATRAYLKLLVRDGYCALEHKGGREAGNEAKYRLLRNSGHGAPLAGIDCPNDLRAPPRPDRPARRSDPTFILKDVA